MFSQKPIVVLFINRNTLQLFGGPLTGIITLEAPETILRDGEVVSVDGAYTLIKQLVKQYTLAGTQIFIVLSDLMYFEKVFPVGQAAIVENDILSFFNVVPFESVITKVYEADKGKRAVAVNKTVYETLKQGFALQGIPIKALIPSCVIPGASGKHMLDAALAGEIQRNIDALTRQNVLDTQEAVAQPPEPENTSSPGKKKSNLPALLGVFGLLVAILIIVIFLQPR